MLFDFLKKNKKSEAEPEVSKEEFNAALAEYAASKMTFGVVESEPVIPDYQGDYAKAIFLWANAKKSPIKDDEDYPRYILYECGIRNASDYHRKMVAEDYLREDGFAAALESLKLAELKEIAADLGVAATGKKADIAKRIADSGNAAHLERQMPTTYSLTEKGKEFVEQYDDCIQIHRHKTWMIDWDEYSEIKGKNPEGTFYSICNEILLKRAAADKRLFGRIEYLNLSKLEDEFGDPRKSIRYLLQVIYIDVSGVMGMDSYNSYREGIYQKQFLKEMFITNVPIAPGIINLIQAHKEYYDSKIIDKLYTWTLPIMLCERELFEEIVNSIFDGSFNTQFYSAQLKVRYERFIDKM